MIHSIKRIKVYKPKPVIENNRVTSVKGVVND